MTAVRVDPELGLLHPTDEVVGTGSPVRVVFRRSREN